MAIAEEVLFSKDIRCTIRKHTTNVKIELGRHKIKKYSDLIASQCVDIVCPLERGLKEFFLVINRFFFIITYQ